MTGGTVRPHFKLHMAILFMLPIRNISAAETLVEGSNLSSATTWMWMWMIGASFMSSTGLTGARSWNMSLIPVVKGDRGIELRA